MNTMLNAFYTVLLLIYTALLRLKEVGLMSIFVSLRYDTKTKLCLMSLTFNSTFDIITKFEFG